MHHSLRLLAFVNLWRRRGRQNVQVCHELLVGEEEEKEEEQGRHEEREVEREGQGEETVHMDGYVDESEKRDSNLSQMCG